MELNAAPADDLIKDSTEASFMADVIEASQTQPVIVDFWAPLDAASKALEPMLEAAVRKLGGKVKLVKVNAAENQNIAAQLRIQTVPTVYAFVNGQPVDAFQGPQSPSQIDAFLDKLAKAAPASPIDEALEQAAALVAAGDLDAARQYYAAVLAQEPQNETAILGLTEIVIELGDFEKAREILATLPDPAKGAALMARIDMLEAAANAGPVDELLTKIEADPKDHQARLDAATALYALSRAEEAIDQLIESFRIDREWNDGAARAQLLQTFEAMDPKDPILAKGRRKFTSLVFA